MASHVGGGPGTRAMLPLMAIVAPELLLALLGMKIYVGISPAAFRSLALGAADGASVFPLSVPASW